MTSTANRKYITYRDAAPEENRVTATINTPGKSGEVRPCGYRDTRADRLTDRQTDTPIATVRTLLGGNKQHRR